MHKYVNKTKDMGFFIPESFREAESQKLCANGCLLVPYPHDFDKAKKKKIKDSNIGILYQLSIIPMRFSMDLLCFRYLVQPHSRGI